MKSVLLFVWIWCAVGDYCTHSCDSCGSGTVCRQSISGYECPDLVCGECTGGSFDTCMAACWAAGSAACDSVCKADCPETTTVDRGSPTPQIANTAVAIAEEAPPAPKTNNSIAPVEEADSDCSPARYCARTCDQCCSGTICRRDFLYGCNYYICGECTGGSFDSCMAACSVTMDWGACVSECKEDCPETTTVDRGSPAPEIANTAVTIVEEAAPAPKPNDSIATTVEAANSDCSPARSCAHTCDQCCSGTTCRLDFLYGCNYYICGECTGGSFDSCMAACSVTMDWGACVSECKEDCSEATMMV